MTADRPTGPAMRFEHVSDHAHAICLACGQLEARAVKEGRAAERSRIFAALPEALESLAAIEHEQWEQWSREIAEQGLTSERIDRWHRYWVPYAELDEATKEHDRKWARLSTAALAAAIERVLGEER